MWHETLHCHLLVLLQQIWRPVNRRSHEFQLVSIVKAKKINLCRYVLEFEKCLDKTDPVPWEVIRGRMRAQLGRPLEDVFSFVDPVPLASASVAQVHSAGGGCFHFLSRLRVHSSVLIFSGMSTRAGIPHEKQSKCGYCTYSYSVFPNGSPSMSRAPPHLTCCPHVLAPLLKLNESNRGQLQVVQRARVALLLQRLEPLSAAPCAAVLKDSGKEVVVKVLKPGVEDVLATDLDFLYLASRVFEFINPELSRMSLAAIVGDIRACMLEEVRPVHSISYQYLSYSIVISVILGQMCLVSCTHYIHTARQSFHLTFGARSASIYAFLSLSLSLSPS